MCVADGSALPPGLIYAAESENIQSTWVEDVKVGKHPTRYKNRKRRKQPNRELDLQ